MPSTFITGAPGWLGTRLVQALTSGLPDFPGMPEVGLSDHIRCLALPGADMSALGTSPRPVEVSVGDVRDERSVRNFLAGGKGGVLFHCAGVIHPRFRREFFDVNVSGTENLLRGAQDAGLRRVVVVSSNSTVGTNPSPDHSFDESSPYNPYMGYGRSKMLMEQMVHRFRERGKIETVIVRAPWFYGPGQPPRQTLFFTMIKLGKFPLLGDGFNKRSMCYVDNLCHGLILCAIRPEAGGRTYWIADERAYSMNEILDTVKDVLERDFGMTVSRRRLKLPSRIGDIARLGDRVIQGLGLYHQKVHVLSEMNTTIACNVSRAKTELGYRPAVSLEEGMRRSIKWCLETGIRI